MSSCINTPQQNRVTEKNHHLLEIAQSHMFCNGVPIFGKKPFLPLNISLIACHLVFENLVHQVKPSLTYSLMHARVISIDLPFKMFRCSAFVHVYP